MKNTPLNFCNITVQPGERITVALPTPELYTCAPIYMPIHIIHGKKAGPTLLVCGAIHGDEINGVAIIQRLLKHSNLDLIRGTLIVIPTLNVYGMMTMSRNLPDRRDLDGSFPGSKTGSFASRLAFLLTEEVFNKVTHCIDLHTGEPNISKFSQTKTSPNSIEAMKLAHSFRAPILQHTDSHEGLLWLMHREEKSVPTIIYCTGEALRLDQQGIKIGVEGILHVMKDLEMISTKEDPAPIQSHLELEAQTWARAPSSGLCEIFHKIGDFVQEGELLAKIFDPFGTDQKEDLLSPCKGIVTATNNLPIVNEGEPIAQVAVIKDSSLQNMTAWKQEVQEVL